MIRPLPALLIAAATLLLWHLGAYGLWESTEARYAEIAARMVRSGDWVTPRLNYIAHFDKPPFAYWATGAGLALFGIDAFGARIGLVLASLATLAIVYRWVEETDGPRTATYALIALLTAPLYFALSRSVTTDLYLTLWVVLAADAARRGTRPDGARGWRIVAWLAVGLGFLTKGHVVLLWTVAPAAAWAAWTGNWARLRRLADPVGIAAALVVAAPWFVATALRHPGLLEHWLGAQTMARAATAYEGERAAIWALVPVVMWGAAPWIAPAALELARRRPRTATPYALAWIVVPLVLFSLFPTKRVNYVVPLLPAIAIAAARWWGTVDERSGGRALIVAIGGGVAIAGIGLTIAAGRVDLPAALAGVGRIAGPIWVATGVATLIAAHRRRFDLAFVTTAAALAALYLVGYSRLQHPEVEAYFKISRPLAVAAAQHGTPGAPIIAVRDWPRAFPFYLDRRIVTVGTGARPTDFETDPSWREFVHPDEAAFFDTFEPTEGTLLFLPRSDVPEIESRIGRRLRTIAATRRHALAAADQP